VRDAESGVALILVLIFTVLIYALVAELVTTARTARLTGENDALLARMHNHMVYSLTLVEQTLIEDLQAAAAAGSSGPEGGGAGGVPGLMPGSGAAGGAAGGEGGEEPDASAVADGSQDAWFQPTAYSDGDLTTYVWVEDENRKFNILTLVSPDQDFARLSRERFVRLIDVLRQDTDYDLSRADGEAMADRIIEWFQSRTRTQDMPRPPLKSDQPDEPERSNVSLPLVLDELLLLSGIDEEIYYDKVLDSRLIPGLESALTIYTSLVFDPGDPERLARQGRQPTAPGAPGAPTPGAPAGTGGEPTSGGGAAGGPASAGPQQPEGVGIRININTAPRAVLRCLFPPGELPDSAIDAILKFRNEEVEQDPNAEPTESDDYLSHVREGEMVPKKMFDAPQDVDEIPEFQNLPDPTVKDKFFKLVTTTSDVFSIHMASLYKRNEETRSFVMRRARSVMMRMDDGEDGKLHPVILLEERNGMRVMPIDLPDDVDRMAAEFDEMDAFTQEERAWNPFHLEFYRPKYERERMFSYRSRR
jgi:type II secretory pathway component PulK